MSLHNFITTDAEKIAADNLAAIKAGLGRELYPGDPVRVLGLTMSYIQAVAADAANYAGNQSFVNSASGASLDGLGVLVGVTRRAAEAARTTLRFRLGAARGSATLIPKGTRATVNGSGIYWATIEAAEIAAGSTTVDVIAEASVPGIAANGYLTGEINTLVDAVSFVTAVSNISASSDGSEPEDDESLRKRIMEAPAALSTAGPEDAYIAQTKAARADIESVSINSPSPRVIDIYFTLTAGALPAAETIAEVLAYVSDTKRRPMSDLVQVHAPTPANYSINLTYYISNANSASAGQIEDAVEAAVDAYVAWQKGAIGRDINPTELIKRIGNAGALRVAVTSPGYQALDYAQLAQLSGAATVTFGGLVDE